MAITNPVYPQYVKIYANLNDVWTNISQYVVSNIKGFSGISGTGFLDRVADVGTLDFTINNASQMFSPANALALSGWQKGTEVKVEVTYSNSAYIVFKGVVDSIKPDSATWGNRHVKVNIVDWIDYSMNTSVVNPAVLSNPTPKKVLEEVVNLIPRQPDATDFDLGSDTFTTALDLVKTTTTVYSEFGKVALSEPAYVYLKRDKTYGETLTYEDFNSRTGLRELTTVPQSSSGFFKKTDGSYLIKTDGGKIKLNDSDEAFFDNLMIGLEADEDDSGLINYVTLQAFPRRVSTSALVLFALDSPLLIGSGKTLVIKGTYTDPTGGMSVSGQNMITPVITTDYLVNTASDGSGSNISSSLVLVTVNLYSDGFEIRVRNDNASDGYITKFNVRGFAVYVYNPVELVASSQESIDQYGQFEETVYQKYRYGTVGSGLIADTILEFSKDPRVKANKVTFLANTSDFLMHSFLRLGVGDLIRVKEEQIGIDALYFIQGVEFEITLGGIIIYSYTLREHFSNLLGLTEISVEFRGKSTTTDAINFDYVPRVSNLTQRSIGAEIYLHTDVPDSNYYGIVGYGVTYLFSLKQTRRLQVYQVHSGGGAVFGVWLTPVNSVPLNTWTKVLVTHDTTAVTNKPIIYIDGVAQTLTESSSPAGTLGSETGAELVIGNSHAYNNEYLSAFDGEIKNVRIYNVILTPSEAADYTDVTRGLVFNPFSVQTSKLDQYIDNPITGELKTIDNYLLVIGHPNDAPIAREV